MPLRRLSTAAFGAVAGLSLVVLFAPNGGGEQRFPHDDKVVHLLLFAALAASARWRFGPAPAALLGVAAYAPASELVQAGVLPGRSGDVRDVAADLAGVALGWYLTGRRLERVPAERQAGAGERTVS